MDIFLKRVLPLLIILTGVGAGLWYRNDAAPTLPPSPPSPRPESAARSQATSALPSGAPPASAPTESSAPLAESDFDPCHAENAHDLWYRIASEYAPRMLARNYHFAASDGRTLLIRQQSVSAPKSFVQVTAQWYGRNSAAETVPKEILNETRFLEFEEIAEVAGPAWMERVTDGARPLLTEEAFQLGSDTENVTMRNGVAYSLKIKRNGKSISCDKDEPCHCI